MHLSTVRNKVRVGVWLCFAVLGLLFNPADMFPQGGMASPRRDLPATKPPARAINVPDIFLEEVSAQAGLNFRHNSGEEINKKFLLEATGGGVAIFDYDNDGLPDVFFVNGDRWNTPPESKKPTNQLFKNLGKLRFQDVTEEAGLVSHGWGQGVCVGDYDNDGNEDLLVTQYGHNLLYRNDGKGHFANTTATAELPVEGKRWSTGCSFFDYDRDGDLDIAVANYINFDPKSTPLPGEGLCVFKGLPVVCGPRGLPTGQNILYRNQGDGTFVDVSKTSGFNSQSKRYCFSTIASDFDNDGWADVYFACDSTPSALLHNNGDGTFTDIGIPVGVAFNENGQEQGSMGADAADFDHTGRQSIVVTTFDDDIPALFRHDADGFFTDVALRAGLGFRTHRVGWGTAFIDLNNDGWKDIFMVNGHVYPNIDQLKEGGRYRQKKNVYYNLRDGTFADITDVSGPAPAIPTSARGLAYGDLENDGSLAIVINNIDSPAQLLVNRRPKGNWISFKLIGVKSNRSAIGARVTVKSGPLTQTGEVRSGCCYLSQSDTRLHFGLGSQHRVDEVDVLWPNGLREKFAGPSINSIQRLTEGNGNSQPQHSSAADSSSRKGISSSD